MGQNKRPAVASKSTKSQGHLSRVVGQGFPRSETGASVESVDDAPPNWSYLTVRVYIAGPITGHECDGDDPWRERKEAFRRAAQAVKDLGFTPVVPWDLHPADVSWEDALRADIAGLVTCDGIYLMQGYAASRGAQLELHIAKELGMFIIYEDHEETILEEADRIVSGDRGPQYGDPNANFKQTAELWTAYKGVTFRPEDVAAFMVLLKLARQAHRPKRDNLVDICGYVKCWGMLNDERDCTIEEVKSVSVGHRVESTDA